jgi:FKBP-type peptidyl-prolyl cis-trans isomerase
MLARRLQRLMLVLLPLALLSTACGESTTAPPTGPTTQPPPQGPADMQITDLVEGDGDELQAGLQGTFIYSLWHYSPTGTDSKGALIQSQTFSFRPGVTAVIQGVATGVIGMKVHGKRRLIIPPNLAYGATGNANGSVAPNEWIVFEFELLEVRDCAVSTCQS